MGMEGGGEGGVGMEGGEEGGVGMEGGGKGGVGMEGGGDLPQHTTCVFFHMHLLPSCLAFS